MSRSFKTRPWWVKLAEHPGATCRAEHDHRFGDCDLPESPGQGVHGQRCRWGPTSRTLDGPGSGCPCEMCHGGWFNRQMNRRDRHDARRSLRGWLGRTAHERY